MKFDANLLMQPTFKLALLTLLLGFHLAAQEPKTTVGVGSNSVPLERLLHKFRGGTDGAFPGDAGVVFDKAGTLYGTTGGGGNGNCVNGCGTVFQLRPVFHSPDSIVGGSGMETVIYNFQGGTDGKAPESNLILDESGNLYGTTFAGGDSTNCSDGCGTVFELSPSAQGWTESVLYRFQGGTDGANPQASPLVLDTAGNLYGTTLFGGSPNDCANGGCGTVFELKPTAKGWKESVIYTFHGIPDGNGPSQVNFDKDGNLWGTTFTGGGTQAGTVFEMTRSRSGWTHSVIYTFCQGGGNCVDGEEPFSGITFDQSGNLYGTTLVGGAANIGTVFELTQSGGLWREKVLYSFSGGLDGGEPQSGLVIDRAGNLYGTTPFGGFGSTGGGMGTVFTLTRLTGSSGWIEKPIYWFCLAMDCEDGVYPLVGVVTDNFGNLYGTTDGGGDPSCQGGCGVVFDIAAVGSVSGPDATLAPSNRSFPPGYQLVGTSTPALPVVLSNLGTKTLKITSIVASGDFSQTNNCPLHVPPGRASCAISVIFTPTDRGPRHGTLTVTDNAHNSPQTAKLTGVGTVVELSPPSLDFGAVKEGQRKSLQTILTNTGNISLNIRSIILTGDTQHFSQGNDCPDPGQLAAGASCTITVTFAPSTLGYFTADVAVRDDGGGSPQQVSLSGKGCFLKCRDTAEDLTGSAARTAIASNLTATVPNTADSKAVGTRVLRLVDHKRTDLYSANAAKRELLVRFWYPTSLTQGCEPAAYTSEKVWSYFSTLLGISLPEVRTNSCQGAPVADGAHPVVLFTPGYTGTFTDYTFILEDLASRGYVVASLDHTYEATAVEFPDGTFIKGVLGSHFGHTWKMDEKSLSLALSVRAGDLTFVVDELERLNAMADGPFAGKLDTTHIALMGHSLGGLATILGIQKEPRIKAAVSLDGELTEESTKGTDKAVFLFAMGREQWTPNECRLWSNLRGPRLAVNLKGAEHITPTDAVWLAEDAIRTSAMGRDKTIAAVRDYIAAFLDANLQGMAADRLLTEPPSEYPDAAVTTQKQLLCRKGL